MSLGAEVRLDQSLSSLFDGSVSSVLPGEAVADLDWDDEEEATSVFDRSTADLFSELGGRGRLREDADSTARRDVSRAAALLSASGRSAAPVKSVPPVVHQPLPVEPIPRIPAPAPMPRDMSAAVELLPADAPSARPPHPSWVPSMPPAAPATAGRSIFLLAAVAIVVVAVAGFFYVRHQSPAAVTVLVTYHGKPVDRAAIYVDGQPKCQFSPCKLELKPGSKEIRVAAGPLAGSVVFDVKAGNNTVVVPLSVSTDTLPPLEPTAEQPARAAISLKTTMTEQVKVLLDGKEQNKLPLVLKDLAPGKHTLRFEPSSEQYGVLEKTIDLKPGETFSLDDIMLPLKLVQVSFELETRGATVKLLQDGGSKGEDVLAFRANKVAKTLDTSSKWTILATLSGYEDLKRDISFDDGKPEQRVVVKLAKAEEAAPPPPAVTAGPKVAPPPVSVAAPTSTSAPTATPDPGGGGFINANSIPPSYVIIDGRPHGQTPVTGVKVSAGSHTVTFKYNDQIQSRSVMVAAGKTATATVKFKPGGSTPTGGGETDKPDKPKKKKKKKKKKDE